MNNEPLDLNWQHAAELVPPPFRMAEAVEEPVRCELDHRDGGVCLRRLAWDGSCPGEDDHADGAS